TAGLQRYYVLGPEQRALFWKDTAPIAVTRFDLAERLALPTDLATRLVNSSEQRAKDLISYAVYHKTVPEAHSGLLYVDGELIDVLPAGLYAYWNVRNDVRIDLYDLLARSLEVQGQEILTRDKVALRVNVTASVRYVDPTAAKRNARDPMDQLYKAIQFGLRAAVGTRRLDTLLEDKTALDSELSNYLEGHVAVTGLAVESIGVKDIILPGDMKMLMAQVVEAEKAAQANVIRRREETNATRSLLNTAKVMEGNPVALRLRELDTLEKVTKNVGNLSVSGGLEGLLKDLVRLNDGPSS
ncbi:MAG: slipin family protein, partial [Pseudomonadota bacterium]